MYVVLEGNNNTGKSTQLPRIKEKLQEIFQKRNIPLQITTYHEGDTTTKNKYINIYEEILDYAKDRATHLPEIKQNHIQHIVISDRSIYSSLVYQTKHIQNQQEKTQLQNYIRQVNTYIPTPDLVIFFQSKDKKIDKEYLKVIPFEKICFIPQKDAATIEETTQCITREIITHYLQQYHDQTYLSSISHALEWIK